MIPIKKAIEKMDLAAKYLKIVSQELEEVTDLLRYYDEKEESEIDQSPVWLFLESSSEIDDESVIGATDSYEKFKAWCDNQPELVDGFSQKTFGQVMGSKFERVKRGGKNFYKGLRWPDTVEGEGPLDD